MKLQTLRRDFETLEMKESDKIDQYMTQVMKSVNQLKVYSEDVMDHNIFKNILITLSNNFYLTVPTIE